MPLTTNLRAWFREGTASREPQFTNSPAPGGTPARPDENFWRQHLGSPDPYGALIDWRRCHPDRPVIGLDMTVSTPMLVAKDSSLLVIGRPGTGKTSAVTIINAALAPAGLLFWGTRSDGYRVTAALRARIGDLWALDAHGVGLEGAKLLSYSLLDGLVVDGRVNYKKLKARADRLVRSVNMTSGARQKQGGESPFWDSNSSELLAACLLICIKSGRLIADVGRACARLDDNYFEAAAAFLQASSSATMRAKGDWLAGFVRSYAGQRSGTYAHVANALSFWMTDEGIRCEEHARAMAISLSSVIFGDPAAESDLAASVLSQRIGGPRQSGRYPSIYIADAGNDDPAKPYYTEFVNQVMELLKERAEANYRAGRSSALPFTFCFDELAQAHVANLFDNQADARGRDIVTIGAIQDTDQLRQMYGIQRIGDAHSKMGTLVICGGLTNVQDASDLSDLTERTQLSLRSNSQQSHGDGPVQWSPSVGAQVHPRLSTDEIARGHHEPQTALVFHPNASWNYARIERYFDGPHWSAVFPH